MKRLQLATLMHTVALVVVGCGGAEFGSAEEATPGTAAEALENSNYLNPNYLNPNALNSNYLNPNYLNPNALAPSTLSLAALTAISDSGAGGTMARMLLKYTVGCAFNATQSFNFTWIDSAGIHAESYAGLLGLAPYWSTQPLDLSGQQWVSACLASRTNWYGVSVMISSRGNIGPLNRDALTNQELVTYPNEEGAFWGNLFAASPALYACSYAPNNGHSRSLYRDCAAGHVNTDGTIAPCGMIALTGSCASRCATEDTGGLYYAGCMSDLANWRTATSHVVTTFLP